MPITQKRGRVAKAVADTGSMAFIDSSGSKSLSWRSNEQALGMAVLPGLQEGEI